MGGKYGVKNIKDCVYLGKVVTLCILREIKKDGYQHKDLGAFLKSAEFEAALAEAIKEIELVLPEAAEIGLLEGVDLAKYVYSCVDDILGEVKALAAQKAVA